MKKQLLLFLLLGISTIQSLYPMRALRALREKGIKGEQDETQKAATQKKLAKLQTTPQSRIKQLHKVYRQARQQQVACKRCEFLIEKNH